MTSGILAPFGLRPHLGRDLVPGESSPGGPKVAVTSHGFWRNRLGEDPDVLGRTLEFQGESFEIVGVAPEGFHYPGDATLWRPYVTDPESCGRDCRAFSVVARLAPEATLHEARDQARPPEVVWPRHSLAHTPIPGSP